MTRIKLIDFSVRLCLSVYLCFVVYPASASVRKITKTQKSTKSTKKYKVKRKKRKEDIRKVKNNFDEIRDFSSYDPATGKWSSIEEFKGVEILTDPKEVRSKRFLYQNFWAYDSSKGRWYNVHVPDHGYHIDIVNPDKGRFWLKFFRNIALDFSLGFGLSQYTYSVSEPLEMVYKKIGGEDCYFVRAPLSPTTYGYYTVRPLAVPVDQVLQSKSPTSFTDTIPISSLIGKGFNIPALALSLHYTYKDRIRLGVKGTFTYNFVEVFQTDDFDESLESNDSLSYTIKPSMVLGCIVYQGGYYNILVDANIGQTYYVARDKLKNVFDADPEEGNYTYRALYGNLGCAYERNVGPLLRYFARVSFEMSQGKLYSIKDKEEKLLGSPILSSLGVQIETGIGIHFAKLPPKKYTKPVKKRHVRRRGIKKLKASLKTDQNKT